MEPVGDAQFGYAADDVVEHVAAAGHDEPHARHPLEHLGRRLDEVVRSFLVGDASQKRDDLVVHGALLLFGLLRSEPYRVVYRDDLFGRNAVFVDDDAAREVAHRHDAVGRFHSGAFDGVDLLVDAFAAAVELGGVHVHDERLARYALGGDAGVVGQPVVRVDQVELPFQIAGHLCGDHRIAGHLFHQVGAVFAGKFESLLPQVAAGGDPARAAVFLRARLELFGRDVGDHVGVDADESQLVPDVFVPAVAVEGFHVAGIDHLHEPLVFVTVGFRDDEDHLRAVFGEASGQSVRCRSQTSRYVGREFPSEHQYSHLFVFIAFNSLSVVFFPCEGRCVSPVPCRPVPGPFTGRRPPVAVGRMPPERGGRFGTVYARFVPKPSRGVIFSFRILRSSARCEEPLPRSMPAKRHLWDGGAGRRRIFH